MVHGCLSNDVIQSDIYPSRLLCGLGFEAVNLIPVSLSYFLLSLRTACPRAFLSDEGCMLCNGRELLGNSDVWVFQSDIGRTLLGMINVASRQTGHTASAPCRKGINVLKTSSFIRSSSTTNSKDYIATFASCRLVSPNPINTL